MDIYTSPLSLQSGGPLLKDEDFDLFLQSGIVVQDIKCPRVTVLVATGNVRTRHWRIPIQERFTGSCEVGCNRNHADVQFIRKLQKNFKDIDIEGKITLMSNHSPCRYCSECLIDFAQEKPGVKITILTTNLHNVHPSDPHPGMELERMCWCNVKGLQKLAESGVKLVTFSSKHWKELLALAGRTVNWLMCGYSQIQTLVGSRGGSEVSATWKIGREMGDKHSLRDLQEIQRKAVPWWFSDELRSGIGQGNHFRNNG